MKESLFVSPIIIEILKRYKDIWAIDHMTCLAAWDMSTYMPEQGLSARGEALAKAGTIKQRIFLDKEFVRLIRKAKNEKGLNDYEQGIVRVLSRSLEDYEKLPASFLEEFSKAATKSENAWKKARAQNEFSLFLPHLEKMIELSLKKADYLGYKKSPYNALLDEFEEGLTIGDVQQHFSAIKNPLKDLLEYIKTSPRYKKSPLENLGYDREAMKALNLKALRILNYDPKRMRLDVSAHPFIMSLLSTGDARITTRYSSKGFSESLGSTIHEFGHALHELQAGDFLQYSPIFSCASFVVSESQSLFWENFVGKDKAFIIFNTPLTV